MDSSSTTPTPESDTQLLSIGKQCSHSTCNLVDFLPFKCHHCQQSFCQEHFKVEDHKCSEYDERKHDRIAPSCPLCSTPVSVRIGQDPNIAMDSHLENECSVMTGKANARNTPVCARSNCQKVLKVPMKCQSCKKSFCTNHRFPDDHYCSAKGAPSAPSKSPTPNSLNTKATAMGNAAMGAMKKSISQASTPPSRTTPPAKAAPLTSTPSSSKPLLPFSKMDRRSVSPSTVPSILNNNTASTSSTTIDVTTNVPDTINAITNEIIKPPHIIDFTSYIPQPLFASA